MLFRSLRTGVLVAAASLMVLAGGVTSAHAQPRGGGGMMMMGGGMFGGGNNTINAGDLERMGKLVKMTPEQLDSVKTLHTGYTTEMAEQRKKMDEFRQKFIDDMRESGERPDFTQMGEKMRPMMEGMQKTEGEFLDNVKSILTPDQANSWPRVEKMRRREQTVRQGFMAGEAVDLSRMVDGYKLDDEQMKTVTPILERYETELDSALTTRNQHREAQQGKMQTLMQDVMSGNSAEADKLLTEARGHSQRVRDINRRYERELEGALPKEDGPKLAEDFRKASYPQIYRNGARGTGGSFDAAMKIEDLNDTQKSGLAALKDSYTRESGSINKKLEEAQDEGEKTMTVQSMMQRGFGGGNDAENDLRKQRRELDTKTLASITALLTEQQRTLLPTQTQGGDNAPGGRMRGGDNGGGDNAQPARRRLRGNGNGNGNGGGNNGGGGNG
ncbi:hypothetical protein BH11PLA1_BH11PLA1_17050 [soil metagenome]